MSCDEAFIDVTDYDDADLKNDIFMADRAQKIASKIREEIREVTRCNASVGISFNMLLARMATHKAKPNNQFIITDRDVLTFMNDAPVTDLPG